MILLFSEDMKKVQPMTSQATMTSMPPVESAITNAKTTNMHVTVNMAEARDVFISDNGIEITNNTMQHYRTNPINAEIQPPQIHG
jgi:hypothetical protein